MNGLQLAIKSQANPRPASPRDVKNVFGHVVSVWTGKTIVITK